MSSVLDDFRKQPCPNCKQTGLYMDPASGELRCRHCKASGLKPTTEPPKQDVPPLPSYAPASDLVEEFWTDKEGKRHKVATIYIPKKPLKANEKFDPNSFWVRVALTRFGKEITNRRRYNRDLIKRAKERGEVIGPWNEQWAIQNQLDISAGDQLLAKAADAIKRQRRRRRKAEKQ